MPRGSLKTKKMRNSLVFENNCWEIVHDNDKNSAKRSVGNHRNHVNNDLTKHIEISIITATNIYVPRPCKVTMI
jgi:hypothetical protein